MATRSVASASKRRLPLETTYRRLTASLWCELSIIVISTVVTSVSITINYSSKILSSHQVTSLVHDPPYLISAPVVGTNNSMSFLRFVLHALQVVASAPQILAFALLRVLTRTFKFVRTVWVSRRGRHSGPRQRQDSLLEAHPRGADRHAAGERGVPREAPQVLVVLASAAALKLVTL